MAEYIEKECKKHGIGKHRKEVDKKRVVRYRCCKCGTEKVQRRRKKVKLLAIEYKGGKCIVCGYNKCPDALCFHHEQDDKEFGISAKGYTRSFEKVKKELDKCVLLCANCHSEEHERLNLLSSSSEAERHAVNVDVVGSIPTSTVLN